VAGVTDTDTAADWKDILVPGESILWQGQPDPRIIWRDMISLSSLFGLIFAAFAIFWSGLAWALLAQGGARGIFMVFPLAGLPFALIGLYLMVGHLIRDAHVRRATHYTLTTQNAFVARNLDGRRTLESWPYDRMEDVMLEDADPGTVWFARGKLAPSRPVVDKTGGRRRHRVGGTTATRIGFRHIPDARRVHGLIARGVQAARQGATCPN